MMMRFVVPAVAVALALVSTPVLAADAAMTAAQKQCAQLETTMDAQMPEARPSQVAKATKERQEGEQLCNSGKPQQGVVMLQQALRDAMYRG